MPMVRRMRGTFCRPGWYGSSSKPRNICKQIQNRKKKKKNKNKSKRNSSKQPQQIRRPSELHLSIGCFFPVFVCSTDNRTSECSPLIVSFAILPNFKCAQARRPRVELERAFRGRSSTRKASSYGGTVEHWFDGRSSGGLRLPGPQ